MTSASAKSLVLKRKKTGMALALAGLAAALLSACSGSAQAESSGGSGPTSLQYQGWTDQVSLPELAQALGFFNGKVKLDWVGNTISGPQDIQSAATGQTDFGGAFGGAVAKLESSGAQITAVVNYYGGDAKTFSGYYVLDKSPIKTPADLVGKKIGVNTLGGQNEADVYNELSQAGLPYGQIKKATLVPLPPPNTEDALRKGQIDVAALGGQFQQRAVAAGGIRPIFTEFQQYGAFNGGQYVFRNDFIKKHPQAVRAFVDGVGRAIEWERTTPRDQVIAEQTKIIDGRHRPNEDTSSLKYWLSLGVPSRYGVISDDDFSRWQNWLVASGAVKHPVDPSKLYTNEFNPHAGGTSVAASATATPGT
jgi:ABC-type nitrate/sulfonate/bicarbonate transport system substrate-binding protein